jgi:hypothetical protein
MWKAALLLALVLLAAMPLLASPAVAAPVPIAAATQLRGHLPELGTRPSLRVFQTANAYETFRASLSDPNFFPPASRLFMSFEREVLALYARGDDVGGRCLRSGSTASVDGDTVTLDLAWESGTCGAPATARHPFVLVSLSRTASDGTAWVQPTRSVCAAPPGVDPRACVSLGGATTSPSPTAAATPTAAASPSPAPATPSPSPVPSPSPTSPTPTTAAPSPQTSAPATAAPTVALASPTPTRSPDPTARPVEVPRDDSVNLLLWGALGLILLFVIAAGFFARSPRR